LPIATIIDGVGDLGPIAPMLIFGADATGLTSLAMANMGGMGGPEAAVSPRVLTSIAISPPTYGGAAAGMALMFKGADDGRTGVVPTPTDMRAGATSILRLVGSAFHKSSGTDTAGASLERETTARKDGPAFGSS
jgi:hypothetical protein